MHPCPQRATTSALSWAVAKGPVEVVELLLEAGAKVHCRDGDGTIYLHGAAVAGNVDIVKVLVSKGVDVNAYDEE